MANTIKVGKNENPRKNLEQWLKEDIAKRYDAINADSSIALTGEEVFSFVRKNLGIDKEQ